MTELFRLYEGVIPHGVDLVGYWHERARGLIAAGRIKRAGLLATQGIRGGSNRRILDRIKETGDIFMAWSDRPWMLDGAAVHVSMIGFDDGSEQSRTLDGLPTTMINSDLTSGLDLTAVPRLSENLLLAFQGPVVVGPFDIDSETAERLLGEPNPDGRSNADVIHPAANAADLTGQSRGWHIIDFGQMSEEEAALYQHPFEHVRIHVKPARDQNRDRQRREYWWRHGRAGTDLRRAMEGKTRQIATPRVSKHRIFVWLPPDTIVTDAVVAIARDDDYFFGVLHSRPHELWARARGTQLREVESGFRYTPTTTFDPFPFPWGPGSEPIEDVRVQAIGHAARELVRLRDGWLNPRGMVASDEGKRSLTSLYNERPSWLELVHRRLDEAVFAAYGWGRHPTDGEMLERLLALNLEREPAVRPRPTQNPR